MDVVAYQHSLTELETIKLAKCTVQISGIQILNRNLVSIADIHSLRRFLMNRPRFTQIPLIEEQQ